MQFIIGLILELIVFIALMTAFNGPYTCLTPFYWIYAKYLFNRYNKTCFNNQLPIIPIKINHDYIEKFEYGYVAIGFFETTQWKNPRIEISCLSRNFKDTIIHELSHFYEYISMINTNTIDIYKSQKNHHGENFMNIYNQAKIKAGIL